MSSPFALQKLTSGNSNADRSTSGAPDPGSSSRVKKLLAILAALIFTAVAISLFVRDTPGAEHYSTRVGEQFSVHFRDMSVITLNTDSTIEIRRDDPTLAVRILKGEVHFDMAPNSQRHLVVSVGNRIQITDTATIFDVRLIEPAGARVTVKEGNVKVSVLNLTDVKLQENQQTAVTSDETRVAIHTRNIPPREVEREFSWLRGYLDFQCETLGTAAKEFNRYNTTHIEILDDATAKVQIGGTFSTTDPTTFAEVLARISPNMRLDTVQRTRDSSVLQLRALDPAILPKSHCTSEAGPER